MKKYRIIKTTDGNGKSQYDIEFERRSYLMPWKKVWYNPLYDAEWGTPYFTSLKSAKYYINSYFVDNTVEVVETGCIEKKGN